MVDLVLDIEGVMDPRSRFEQAYRAHAGAVRTYAARRSDGQTAEEVVADVFLVAWRRLDDVPEEDPLPWLLGVARRALANRRRSAARQQAVQARVHAERLDPAWGPSERTELDEAVWVALERISEHDREALLLVAWEGLTPAQASIVLGLRPNTFSTRLSRARRRFERALAAQYSPSVPETASADPEPSR